MWALSKFIVVTSIAVTVMAVRIRRQDNDKEEPDLSPTRNLPNSISCMTKTGKQGLCVFEGYCSEEHVILPHGVIDNSELREKKDCIGDSMWCCSTEKLSGPPLVGVSPSDKCVATNDDDCPWAVALFKSQTESLSSGRLFCAGSLITSRVVLTAATCILSAQKHTLYVNVPASTVRKNYTVQFRLGHPQYNSGTHVNDYGILVLETDVDWGGTKAKSVCLDFTTKLQGDCITVGFSSDFETITSLLDVKKGSCHHQSDINDVCCGFNRSDDCIATPGSPVLCLSKENVFTVVGVSRSNCRNEKVSIGALSSVSTWLQKELANMNVQKTVFTYGK